MKKMSMSSLAPAPGPLISDHNSTQNYTLPNYFPSQAPRALEPSSDTMAVLEQLAAIQRVSYIMPFYDLGAGD